MTDAEIKKALECCATLDSEGCSKCPLNKKCDAGDEIDSLMRLALDLINRQQAEIERLKDEVNCNYEIRDKACAKLDELEKMVNQSVATTKAEALEQFLKRFESRLANNTDISHAQYQSIIFDINEAYKEMVGDAE